MLPVELDFLVLGHMIHHEQAESDSQTRERERQRRQEGRKARMRDQFVEQRGLN